MNEIRARWAEGPFDTKAEDAMAAAGEARLHGRARKVDGARDALVNAVALALCQYTMERPDRHSVRVQIGGRYFEVRVKEKFDGR